MNHALARRNLEDAVRALGLAGVRPFLVDGTLLGAVREKGFIAHDKDVDLGALIEEYEPWIPTRMKASGFVVHHTYGAPDRGLQFSFKRYGVKVDVFFYYRDEATGELYHAAWLNSVPIRYGYPAFSLAPLDFLGRQYLAPADPEAFLRAKYGPDWRYPVVDWDWAWDPKNARPWVSA